jgi:hypothetical protein
VSGCKAELFICITSHSPLCLLEVLTALILYLIRLLTLPSVPTSIVFVWLLTLPGIQSSSFPIFYQNVSPTFHKWSTWTTPSHVLCLLLCLIPAHTQKKPHSYPMTPDRLQTKSLLCRTALPRSSTFQEGVLSVPPQTVSSASPMTDK